MNRLTDRTKTTGRTLRSPAAIIILCASASGLPAQPTLQITSPANGAVVSSGQTLTVSVAASGDTFQAVQLTGNAAMNGIYTLTAPPYEFAIPIPPDADSRIYFLVAAGTATAGEAVQSDEITIDIERPDPPVQIKNEGGAIGFGYVADQRNLSVTGTYADGSAVTLTYSSLTSYPSDTPAVATVDSMGLVTAVGPGSANITITNAGASATVPVTVPPPLTILPASGSVYASQTAEFDVQFALPPDAPSDQSVTWALNPPVGSIDPTGLYTAPSSIPSLEGVVVTAASVADPTKIATASVWLFPPVSISTSPASATLSAGQHLTFLAQVQNGDFPSSANWSAAPAGVGSIQSGQGYLPNRIVPVPAGTYCAPGVIPSPQTVTVTATSAFDQSKSASAQVSLTPSVALAVSPVTAALSENQSQQFTLTAVDPTLLPATWSLSPNVGSISATGLYAAPAVVTYQQVITATAAIWDYRNCFAAEYTASTVVTLMPHVSSSITAPSRLNAYPVSNSQIDLWWNASSEPGGSIAGYNIFRDGTWAGSSTGTSFSDLGLAAGTAHLYTVAAYDTSWNTSVQSAGVQAPTLSGIPAGLVAYYNFNEGAGTVVHDSSGNANNGAIGGATWAASGQYGSGVTFGSCGSPVQIPPSGSLNLTSGLTMEAWVNPNSMTSGNDVILRYCGWEASCYVLEPNSNGVYVLLSTTNDYAGLTQTPGIPSGTWTHLAATYDGAAVRVFANGVQTDSAPLTGTFPSTQTQSALNTNPYPLYIGGSAMLFGYICDYFDGIVDEVRVYSRALSQAEIQNDMLPPAYALTLQASPLGYGSISATPASASGGYPSGTSVQLTALPNPGFSFGGWGGDLTGTANPQMIAMNGPHIVTAAFTGTPTVVTGSIVSKTGAQNARVWTVQLNNAGPNVAAGASLNGMTLTQTVIPLGTVACTPVVSSAFPVAVGSIPAGGSASGAITINFTGCSSGARFSVNVPFSANGGMVTGGVVGTFRSW